MHCVTSQRLVMCGYKENKLITTTVMDYIRREHDKRRYPTCNPIVNGYAMIANNTIALSFRVNLLNVSQRHEGTYVCKLISALLAEEETTCDFRLSVSGAPENKKGLIIGISIGILLLLPLVAAVIVIRHRRAVRSSQAPGNLNNGDLKVNESRDTETQTSTRNMIEPAPACSALVPYTPPQQYASEQDAAFLKDYFTTDLTV